MLLRRRMRAHLLAAALLLPLTSLACGAPTEDEAAASEDALTSLPAGSYALSRAPLHGAYLKSLTLGPGKSFEMEYVQVRETSEPWIFNPWTQVPTKKETALPVRGTYATFTSDGKQMVSFDSKDPGFDYVMFEVTVSGGALNLKSTMGDAFVLKPSTKPADATTALVASCKDGTMEATLTLDQAGRRRGSFVVTKKLQRDAGTPDPATFPVVYTGDTGVGDYMAFEGKDRSGNGVSFAMKKSWVDRGAASFTIGLGYEKDLTGYEVHHSMTCTTR